MLATDNRRLDAEQTQRRIRVEPVGTTTLGIAARTMFAMSTPPIPFNFEIEELTFAQVEERVLAAERQHGFSSIELLRRYRAGEIEGNEVLEDWLDYVFLFLGSSETRHLVCP